MINKISVTWERIYMNIDEIRSENEPLSPSAPEQPQAAQPQEPQAEAEPQEPAPEPEAVPQPEADAVSEPVHEAEPVPQSAPEQPQAEQPEADAEAVPQPEADAVSEPVQEAEPEHEAEHERRRSSGPRFAWHRDANGDESQYEEPVQRYDTAECIWSEPAFESAADRGDIYTPGRFACGAKDSTTDFDDDDDPNFESVHGHRFVNALCLVLVCALVSALSGWFSAGWRIENSGASTRGVQVIHAAAEPSAEELTVPGYTGQDLTGTEIYYGLATSQVVGVNTSITTNNIFGYTTDTAVSGSGFIISSDGYILTNYHVIAYAALYDGKLTVLLYDGSSHPAEIVGYVEDNDVAVLKIDAEGLTPVVLGDSDAMKVGESVYVVGNPLGELTYTMTGGSVSALDRVITTEDQITGLTTSINMFQLDAAVNSGNSGGPVYNIRGEVIGIVTAKSGESGVEGLGFAIPINDAISLASQLIEKGYVSGAVLGVTVTDTSKAYSSFIQEYYEYPDGACVVSVEEGSAAEKAGVLPGDIIVGLGDRAVASTDELKLALRHYSPGDEATITVYRVETALGKGEEVELSVIFDEKAPEE